MATPDITILYGSQTGNAEDMSKRIGYKVKHLGYSVSIQAMDDFELKILPKQNMVIFVCSTTGHGQEPENMRNFYNFIRRRDLPKSCLSSLRFVVYGLGDSTYSKFNYVSKILFKRLVDCGGNPLQEVVTGDEQHQFGCDGVIYPKLDELWLKLEEFKIKRSFHEVGDGPMLKNSYSVKFYTDGESPSSNDCFKKEFISKYNLETAICTLNHRMTPESHFQDTRFLCFKTEIGVVYAPGDVVSILPRNPEENVTKFIEILNLDPNQRFNLRKNDSDYMINYLYDFIPDGLKVIDLVRYYLDIQSVPKRSFFEFLWPFGGNELERDKLREFASTEGQQEMYDYCVQPKRSIIEILSDFPFTVKNIDFEYIFDLIPPIKPRSFSIASSCSAHPNEIQLIVGVVSYKTRLKKIRKGLCSNYLAGIKAVIDSTKVTEENKLRYFIRSTSFKMPKDDRVPILLIGPGLGIAPFRSFIEDRAKRIKSLRNVYLYFGCRFEKVDYYFRSELEQYSENLQMKLKVAFSREQSRQYVQDLLIEDSESINELVHDENALIYVAGNSKLPEDLRLLFAKVFISGLRDSEQHLDGEKLVARLEVTNRIQYDCW